MEFYKEEDRHIARELQGSDLRKKAILKSFAVLQKSYITDGDTTMEASKQKLNDLRAVLGGDVLTLFEYGNTQSLIDAINSSSLTANKKTLVINILKQAI